MSISGFQPFLILLLIFKIVGCSNVKSFPTEKSGSAFRLYLDTMESTIDSPNLKSFPQEILSKSQSLGYYITDDSTSYNYTSTTTDDAPNSLLLDSGFSGRNSGYLIFEKGGWVRKRFLLFYIQRENTFYYEIYELDESVKDLANAKVFLAKYH